MTFLACVNRRRHRHRHRHHYHSDICSPIQFCGMFQVRATHHWRRQTVSYDINAYDS